MKHVEFQHSQIFIPLNRTVHWLAEFFFIKKKNNKVPLLILISCKHKQHCLDSSKGLGLRPPHTVTVSIDIKPAL